MRAGFHSIGVSVERPVRAKHDTWSIKGGSQKTEMKPKNVNSMNRGRNVFFSYIGVNVYILRK